MIPPRLFVGDKELGKKNDDHKPLPRSPFGSWQGSRRTPHRRSMKRIAAVGLLIIALYFFFKNMPTDLENPTRRPHYDSSSQGGAFGKNGKSKSLVDVKRDFEGPIKFYKLASTLHNLAKVKGDDPVNENVLFAAASLKSASILLPIACEMSLKKRNYVHFALISREDISMDILKAVNGVGDGCGINFHDARPDFAQQATEFRMTVSASAAINHIQAFMHPQAIIIDGSGDEETFFMKGVRERAASINVAIIELPKNTEQTLLWITELDSSSLAAWNKVNIDILIHAPPEATASLARLLKSLKNADYFGSLLPRMIIELPEKVEPTTMHHLENFKWPPAEFAPHGAGSQLSLHHRIPQQGISPEENSIRFMEAFWPARPDSSHVLVLSAQTELSPLYFHYLKFMVLEYKYSKIQKEVNSNLLGISLDLPSTYLNDSTLFTPPPTPKDGVSPFLWQAPNSNAALYFGEKWVELHDLISNILLSEHTLPPPATLGSKLVSKTFPAWLEHILKLARARGYWMLYPNFPSGDAMATTHNELYQIPEEFPEIAEVLAPKAITADADLGVNPSNYLSLKQEEKPLFTGSILRVMNGILPRVLEMPILDWQGTKVTIADISFAAVAYSQTFRIEVGGCGVLVAEKAREGNLANDLFCLHDVKNAAAEKLAAPVREQVEPVPDTTSPSATIAPEPAVLLKGAR